MHRDNDFAESRDTTLQGVRLRAPGGNVETSDATVGIPRRKLVDELARVLCDLDLARLVVRRAGFPRQEIPETGIPLVFWDRVMHSLWDGRVAGGAQMLVRSVSAMYPGNRIFGECRAQADSITDGDLSEVEFAKYRRAVQERYGTHRFVGFSCPIEYGMAWDELYVDLVMDKAHGHTRRRKFAGIELGDERRAVRLEGAFRYAHDCNRRAMVMLGGPGSGKTTQLQHVLLRTLDPARGPGSLGLPDGTVPVYAAIRELPPAIEELGERADFHTILTRVVLKRLTCLSKGLVGHLLSSRRLLYLLDGLDEVSDSATRVRVARMIAAAHADGPPEHRMLVSSRYAGYADIKRVHLGNEFLELRLRALDEKQIVHIVQKWYRAVECREARDQGRPAVEDDALRKADNFMERLRAPERGMEDRLMQLARTPLLLTTLCLIDREQRVAGVAGGLPSGLESVYQECEEVLLGQWQLETKHRIPTLISAEARRILQPVAYWLHSARGRRQATLAELIDPVDRALRVVGYEDVDAKDFVRSFTSESGLVTPWGPSLYGFIHLGFQEHLASLHVCDEWLKGDSTLVKALACRFGEGWWREVIRLTLSEADAGLVECLVTALVQHPDFARWSQTRLMAACMRRAGDGAAQVLVNLLRTPEGTVATECQLAAIRLLIQYLPDAMKGLDVWMQRHPVGEVRRAWMTRTRIDEVTTMVEPRSQVEFVRIPGGWFSMGSAEDDERAWGDEMPRHQVELEEFWLARTPITNAHYALYLEASRGKTHSWQWDEPGSDHPAHPVVGVSWRDAKAYCRWAGFSLPTEAQWEYACRAGTTTYYHSGDGAEDLARVGWFGGNSGGRLRAVGKLEPNRFGLYDMHGNIGEWCEDRWVDDYDDALHRPGDGLRVRPAGETSRVIRGGYYGLKARVARSAYRDDADPEYSNHALGFRPTLELITRG